MKLPWNPKTYMGSFCTYCQKGKKTELQLINHILKEHPGTYAAAAAQRRLDESA